MDIIFSDKTKNMIIKDRYFLLTDNRGNRKFVCINHSQASLAKSQKIDLKFFDKKDLNSFWEIDESQSLIPITSKDFFDAGTVEGEDLDYDNVNIVGNSNMEIYTDESNQKLSEGELKQLKDQAITNQEKVKLVLENNTNHEKRTILSQEKHHKKKDKKYKYKIWAAPITLLSVAETIFIENAKSINFLRMDSISTMLSYANLVGKSNTLIFEECNGLLTSAFTQRSSIHSNIMSIFHKRIKAKYNNLLYMKKREKYPITYMKLDYLVDNTTSFYNLFSKFYYHYFDNIVLCIKDDHSLLKMLTMLFTYVKLCGMIIIFSRELEVLVNIEKILFENKISMDMKIHETIVREFQVLPLRTHPNMNNKGYSGYVLTGIKVNEFL